MPHSNAAFGMRSEIAVLQIRADALKYVDCIDGTYPVFTP